MERLEPYSYKGWRVHYTEGEEHFIACNEAAVLRSPTKRGIEALIDHERLIGPVSSVEKVLKG